MVRYRRSENPSCQKSRSKGKRFKQESAHRKHTRTHMDATNYDLDLQSQASQSQGRPLCQNQGQMVRTGERTDTHTHTHIDATNRIISPATRLIIRANGS